MHPHSRRVLQTLGALLILSVTAGLWLSRGPDYILSFKREVHSPLASADLGPLLGALDRWPEWHFHVIRVEASSQPLSAGTALKLFLEPPKKEWKRFELNLKLTDFQPQERVSVSLESESRGRLERLLTDVHWDIQLLPQGSGKGTLIQGTGYARTNGGRARLLGRMAPRILMNQVFYPNLEALAHPEKRKGRSNDAENGRLLPF
ncbi:MAG: hypothetical protein KGQ59_06545 [Bdellovibrionales bacterium]|nr:hypothetical protein [Bdellovibrionales bacterium]